MKIKSQKKLPYKIYEGSPEDTRNLVISRMIDQIEQPQPPEFFTLLGHLVNSRFLESPVTAIQKDLETLNSRIKHLEATLALRDRTPPLRAGVTNFAAQR